MDVPQSIKLHICSTVTEKWSISETREYSLGSLFFLPLNCNALYAHLWKLSKAWTEKDGYLEEVEEVAVAVVKMGMMSCTCLGPSKSYSDLKAEGGIDAPH